MIVVVDGEEFDEEEGDDEKGGSSARVVIGAVVWSLWSGLMIKWAWV